MLKKSSPVKVVALLVLLLVLVTGKVTVAKSSDRVEQLLARAYFFASNGLAQLASAQFRDAAQADPQNTEARVMAGIALRISGKNQQAIDVWKEAERLGEPAAASLLGDALYESGDLAGAEAYYQRALQSQPNAVRPRLGLALVAESQEHIDVAIELVKPIANADPKSDQVPVIEAFFHLGRLYARIGRYDDAIPVLKQGLFYNPSHAGMHVILGQSYEAKGALAEAVHAYERALQLDPDLTAAAEGLRRVRK